MEESKMEKGMHVTISDDLSNTERAYGTNSDMRQMPGKTYRIDSVNNGSKGVYAVVNHYSWHPKDLTEYSSRKKPEPFHFNVEELSI